MTLRFAAVAPWVLFGLVSMVTSVPAVAGAPDPETARLALLARDLNFAGRWDEAARVTERIAERDRSEPLAPLLAAATLFWRAGVDMGDQRHDAAIRSAIERAVTLAEARIEADDDAHGHFALGEALSFASRLAIERGELVSAGYEGERSRKQLERALELDPTLDDACVPLGAYLYFADLIPAALDWLSWLPFVPSGDRERGLDLLARGHARAPLNRLAARSVLFRIYSRYEPDREEEARRLGSAAYREFPGNPVLALDWLRWQAEKGAAGEAGETATAILASAAAHAEGFDVRVAREARTWLARAEMREGRLDEASTLLDEARRTEPERPRRTVAWEWLTRGQLADRRGARNEAESFYRRVDELEGESSDPEARRLARAFLERPDVVTGSQDDAARKLAGRMTGSETARAPAQMGP